MASRLCLRLSSRPCATGVSSICRRKPLSPALWQSKRIFATTPIHRKEVARIQVESRDQQQQPAEEHVRTESVKKEKPAEPAVKTDPLLAEQTVSNKEQRKADWAIIKDMAHYIWPKDDFGTRFRVGLSVGLLVGAKVSTLRKITAQCSVIVDSICRSSTSKFPSTSNPS